jgi:hypothetical protein
MPHNGGQDNSNVHQFNIIKTSLTMTIGNALITTGGAILIQGSACIQHIVNKYLATDVLHHNGL